MTYLILRGDNPLKLATEVTTHLGLGYELVGGVAVDSDTYVFYQAMVKK